MSFFCMERRGKLVEFVVTGILVIEECFTRFFVTEEVCDIELGICDLRIT